MHSRWRQKPSARFSRSHYCKSGAGWESAQRIASIIAGRRGVLFVTTVRTLA